MKIRCLLTITLMLAAFTTGAFASNKEPDSNFRFSENKSKSEDKKFNNDDDKKAKDEKHVAKRDSEDEYKPLIKNEKNEEKIKIVDFDYKDDLDKLGKIENDDHNDFLKLCQKDKEEHHQDENEDEDDDINAVPVPAALWLFGSGFLGLLGIKRKKG